MILCPSPLLPITTTLNGVAGKAVNLRVENRADKAPGRGGSLPWLLARCRAVREQATALYGLDVRRVVCD